MNLAFVARAVASLDKKMVVIEGIAPESRLTLLGSSVPASVTCGVPVHSLTITNTEGEDIGVIAIHFSRPELRGSNREVDTAALFSIGWKSEKPFDGDKPFMSRPDRLGQIVGFHIEVRSSGKVYTTNPYPVRNEDRFYVPDGNLLCRFLIGRATEEDLQAAITKIARQPELEQRLANVVEEHRRLTQAFAKVELENRTLADSVRDLEEQARVLELGERRYAELRAVVLDSFPLIQRRRLEREIRRIDSPKSWGEEGQLETALVHKKVGEILTRTFGKAPEK